MGLKKAVKKVVRSSPFGAVVSAGKALFEKEGKAGRPVGSKNKTKGKGTGKKRQSVAKIKRKIALLKAKKELSKIRGY